MAFPGVMQGFALAVLFDWKRLSYSALFHQIMLNYL